MSCYAYPRLRRNPKSFQAFQSVSEIEHSSRPVNPTS